MKKVFEYDFRGRNITVEIGEMAKQASSSCLVRYGDTVVLTAMVNKKEPATGDFFPLMVLYQEKQYSVGKIPGGFIKREGRPTENATLAARLIDRPIRPLFPEGFRNEVQIVNEVLSVDTDNSPEMTALFGSSLALSISDLPFMGPVASVVVGRINGEFIINPTSDEQEKSDIYLNFIHFWIEPLTFILKRFGIKRALPHCAKFMKAIGQAYSEAARIYRFRMSTTHRPPPGNNKNLKTIHRLDPHFLCVPSLHIAIIVLTCTFFPAVFKAEGMADDEYQSRTGELYRNGREIAESVLYLKQHSVNCIPAALYMMLHLQSGLFSIEQAVSFINSLFTDADDVTPQGKNKISDHIHYMFDRLVLEGCNEDDWTIPVKRWLINQPLITPLQNKTTRNIP